MSGSILVTGGAGYIGSHACKALAAAGYTPVAFDNLSNGHIEAVRWGPLVRGDIADRDFLAATIEKYQIEGVLHFAARIEVGESMRRPLEYFRNNVAGSVALLQAMVDTKVSHIVFSSTCATYGTPQHLPLDEDHPQVPVSAYGATKLMVEQILGWTEMAHGTTYAALRYFNAAGADPDGETGESHDPESHLIPLILQAALGQRQAIDIYGTDWDTRDGTCIRDYVHVTDLAEAHVLALGHLLNGGGSLKLNLGTGSGHSVREVIDSVERMTGRKIRRREVARRAGDPPLLVADPSRAKAALGWRPHRSDIDTIVATAWAWAQKTAPPEA